MKSKGTDLTVLIAAFNSAFAVAKPVSPLDALIPKPHVEIDYANITGRINGNIKEFLGVFSSLVPAYSDSPLQLHD